MSGDLAEAGQGAITFLFCRNFLGRSCQPAKASARTKLACLGLFRPSPDSWPVVVNVCQY